MKDLRTVGAPSNPNASHALDELLEQEALRHELVAERFEMLNEPEWAQEARERAAECRARRSAQRR